MIRHNILRRRKHHMQTALRVLLAVLVFGPFAWPVDMSSFAGPDVPLMHPRKMKILEQWRELTIESYRQNGVRNPAWDDDLIRLINHALADVFMEDSVLSDEQAAALVTKLNEPGGCADPLAKWCRARLHPTNDERRYQLLKEAVLAFDKDFKDRPQARRHPIILQAICMGKMLAFFNRETSAQPHPSALYWAKRVGAAYAESIRLNECSRQPVVWIRELKDLDINHNNLSAPIVAAIDQAIAASQLDGWVKDGVRGAIRISHAWAYRGGGWGNTVTNEGWDGFGKSLREADELLTRSWKANPSEVLIPAFGCTVAGAGKSQASAAEWFERAERACFDHAEAFDSNIHFLRPRWCGSYERMIDLGCDCVDTQRYDTQVPYWLMRAIITARKDAIEADDHRELAQALDRPRVRKAVQSSLAAYRQREPQKTTYYTCHEAVYEALAGRPDQAALLLAGVPDDKIDATISVAYQVNLKVLKTEARLVVP